MANLRKATKADAHELVRLRVVLKNDIRTTAKVALVSEEEKELMLDYFLRKWDIDNPVHFVQVADDGKSLTGYVALNLVPGDPSGFNPNALIGFVQDVVVDVPHRRKGIGSQLLQYGMAFCRTKGVGYIFLKATKDGAGLYRRLGFEDSDYPVMEIWKPELATLQLPDYAQ